MCKSISAWEAFRYSRLQDWALIFASLLTVIVHSQPMEGHSYVAQDLESSGDSDVIMEASILLHDSDTDPEQSDVEPSCKRQRIVYATSNSDSEFEFESSVDTDDEAVPFQLEENTDTISTEAMQYQPVLRRLPLMPGDESDDIDDTTFDDPFSAGQCNPQDGSFPNQFENTEGDYDNAGDDGNDTGDAGDYHSDGNLEGADSESTQSWGDAWAQDPTNVDPHRLWQVSLPLSQPMPGPSGPVATMDPQVISVTFEQRMRVEMRFSPGLRFGPPQTRVLSNHWALVSTNF